MKKIVKEMNRLLIPTVLLSLGLTAGAPADSITYIAVGKSSSGLPTNLDKLVADKGGEVVRALPQIGAAIVRSSNKNFPAALQKNRAFRAVLPDRMHKLPDEPKVAYGNPPDSGDDDTLFDLQWGHDAVNAPEAWNAGVTGEGVLVAVLDTGVDGTHPDLTPNYRGDLSTSMIFGGTLPDDWHYHGTHVAGTIAAADNAYGVIGVAPDAEVFSVQICGPLGCPTSATVAAVVYAADMGADVANMSIGGLDMISGAKVVKDCKDAGLSTKYCSSLQSSYIRTEILLAKRAFQYANEMNTTIVVAAGNESVDADHDLVPECELTEPCDPEVMVHLPSLRLSFADYPGTIGVAATAPINWCNNPGADFNSPTTYTNYGHSVIDFSAPGGESWYFEGDTAPCTVAGITQEAWVFDLVFSTIPASYSLSGLDPTWAWLGGTSMAAPHVAGVAALVVGENGGDMAPDALLEELKNRAEDAGKPGNDVWHGSGAVRTGY